MQTGEIFDIKKYAIHDGPGIRTTVFFKGCPLSCWWCHNPESLGTGPQRLYRRERCIGCQECLTACSNAAIREFEGQRSGNLKGSCNGRLTHAITAGAVPRLAPPKPWNLSAKP